MKEIVKKYFPVVITALGVFFAITVYFIGLRGTENGIFTDIGTVLTDGEDEQIVSDVSSEAESPDIEIPAIKYIGGARTVGDSVDFKELFQFTYEDGTTVSGTDTEKLVMYFKDVTDMSKYSICERLTTADIESMEEIPSAFVFDQETDILHFHKSGRFMMYIRVYYSANTYVDYEFTIPVEVG